MNLKGWQLAFVFILIDCVWNASGKPNDSVHWICAFLLDKMVCSLAQVVHSLG
jgi:hypothetical protein